MLILFVIEPEHPIVCHRVHCQCQEVRPYRDQLDNIDANHANDLKETTNMIWNPEEWKDIKVLCNHAIPINSY
jgi:hypothetical protein